MCETVWEPCYSFITFGEWAFLNDKWSISLIIIRLIKRRLQTYTLQNNGAVLWGISLSLSLTHWRGLGEHWNCDNWTLASALIALLKSRVPHQWARHKCTAINTPAEFFTVLPPVSVCSWDGKRQPALCDSPLPVPNTSLCLVSLVGLKTSDD